MLMCAFVRFKKKKLKERNEQKKEKYGNVYIYAA